MNHSLLSPGLASGRKGCEHPDTSPRHRFSTPDSLPMKPENRLRSLHPPPTCRPRGPGHGFPETRQPAPSPARRAPRAPHWTSAGAADKDLVYFRAEEPRAQRPTAPRSACGARSDGARCPWLGRRGAACVPGGCGPGRSGSGGRGACVESPRSQELSLPACLPACVSPLLPPKFGACAGPGRRRRTAARPPPGPAGGPRPAARTYPRRRVPASRAGSIRSPLCLPAPRSTGSRTARLCALPGAAGRGRGRGRGPAGRGARRAQSRAAGGRSALPGAVPVRARAADS